MELILITLSLVALAAVSLVWGADSRRYDRPTESFRRSSNAGRAALATRTLNGPHSDSYLSWWPLPTEGLTISAPARA